MIRIQTLFRNLTRAHLATSTFLRALSTVEFSSKSPSDVLLAPPAIKKGPRPYPWIWLKGYFKHTIHACKLSYQDVKYLYKERRDKNPSLDKVQTLQTIKGDILKLIPFSVFIIIPFAEVLIPVYLLFYQNAVPSRFLTQKQVNKRQYALSLKMESSQEKLKSFLLDSLKDVKDLPPEDAKALDTIKEWIEGGVDFQSNLDKFPELVPVFEKYVWPQIQKKGAMLQDFLYSLGVGPLTGIRYFNRILKSMKLPEITLGSPIIGSLFKFLPRMRLSRTFRKLEQMDQYMSEENIDKLEPYHTIVAAFARGTSPLMKDEKFVKDELKKWTKMREKKFPTPFMALISICSKPAPKAQ